MIFVFFSCQQATSMKYGISISEIASPKHAQSTLAKNNATHRGGMRALRIWIKSIANV